MAVSKRSTNPKESAEFYKVLANLLAAASFRVELLCAVARTCLPSSRRGRLPDTRHHD